MPASFQLPGRCAARAAFAAAACACAPAFAAGGHHGVDDATILSRGDCEQESWISRGKGQRLVHAGAQCRVGPVELGAAVEHERGDGSSATASALEVKWARQVAGGWSIGVDLQPVWRAHQRPRLALTQLTALATFSPRPDLNLHLNWGRAFVRGDSDLPRGGVAVEWSPASRWWLMAERYMEERSHLARIGVRWAAGHSWSLDLSRAQRIAGPQASHWSLGLTIALDD